MSAVGGQWRGQHNYVRRPFPSLMVDEEENIHPIKETKMSHDAGGWTPEIWVGIAQWGLGILGTVMTGMGLFLWRMQLKIMLLDRNYKYLEEETEKRHRENHEAHQELVGEMRNNRQALESFHRDLTRRIDNIWPSLNGR